MHEIEPSSGAKATDAPQASSIGVVVIGRNEGERLIRSLRSVQTNSTWLVYVDSGSTDGSIEAAQRLGVQIVVLDRSRPFTAARARNEGTRSLLELHPEIRLLQFIDGDCELRNNWLADAAQFLADHDDVAVVCGRRRERNISASTYNRLCDFEWDMPAGETLSCGGDFLVRARAFEEIGRFAEQLIAGEEPELCARLRAKGRKIWRLNAEMTLHDAALERFTQWWLRAARGGHAMAEVIVLRWGDSTSIWRRELLRALFWGFAVPASIFLGAMWFPVVLLGLLIYPLQISRIAILRGPTAPDSWRYAVFVTLAKFAEMQGIATYLLRVVLRQRGRLIEYK